MIHLDTSALISSLCGARPSAATLRGFLSDGIRLGVSTPVLYEWRRGPRTEQELRDQEQLFPPEATLGFGPYEAMLAASLYNRVARAHRRTIDLAIAACALSQGAALWTLNPQDFRDIPHLDLV